MQEQFTILIADRNPHVRRFLKREMTEEGYHVRLAKTAREVLELVFNRDHLDLLILDLDLPDISGLDILQKLQEHFPVLPVIVHTFLSEYVNHSFVLSSAAFVEKQGNNIDRLKTIVREILRKSYPHRFDERRTTTPAQTRHVQGS